MKTKPTLHTVARQAGVSTATVSKVVNGIGAGVSDATREKVREAIVALGYMPNRLGRSLRTSRHFRVGLTIIDPSPRFLADPFTTNLAAGLANALSERGFGLLLQRVAPGGLAAFHRARGAEADALCLNLSGTRAEREAAMEVAATLHASVVVFQDAPYPGLRDACFIRQDDQGGAFALGDAAAERRAGDALMLVANVSWPAVEHRVAGVRAALERRGRRVAIEACDETDMAEIVASLEARLDREGAPGLVIAQNDQMAVLAMQVLRGRGLRVPEDVGVAGFNAFPFIGYSEPALMTVRSRAYELGRRASDAIMTRLDEGAFRTREIVLPLSLVPGGSM